MRGIGRFTENMGVKYKQCKNCLYGAKQGGVNNFYHCYRAVISGEACLNSDGTDKRGDNEYDCKCFQPGRMEQGYYYRRYQDEQT